MAKNAEQSAPGRLELVRRFVNTRDVEDGTDELASAAAARAWLADRGLPGSGELTLADTRRLAAVREALRELLLANNSGESPPPAALAALNEQSAEAAIGLRFDRDGADLVTNCDGVDSTIAALLAIVHESMRDRSWSRLKVCPADDCLWAFFDHSRNRSGIWCEMGVCGNRAKARAYRERRAAAAGR